MAQMSPAHLKPAAATSFEAAIERLEAIVGEMESGKMPLEDLLARYEEGMKLVKQCQEQLATAEQKIEIITRDHSGAAKVVDFEPKETADAPSVSEMKEDDDVSLF